METKTNNNLINILKGVGISIISTLICLLIFSLILTYTNLSEQTISPVIIVITAISILIGSSIGNFQLKKNGILNGAIIGGLYFIVLYLVSSCISMNFSVNKEMIVMVLIGILFGIFGGIIGVNKK